MNTLFFCLFILFFYATVFMIVKGFARIRTLHRVRPRLLAAEGVVIGMKVEEVHHADQGQGKRIRYAHYPQIEYRTQLGALASFCSEAANLHDRAEPYTTHPTPTSPSDQSAVPRHYYIGQPLSVLYDPQAEITPFIKGEEMIGFAPKFMIFMGCVVSVVSVIVLTGLGLEIGLFPAIYEFTQNLLN